MTLANTLPVIWYLIIGFAVLMYVLLDGFVLGIGILTPFADDEHQRDHMMNTAAPIWDNQTWLVMGGAGLMAAFPIAYATVLSTLYFNDILAMLVALIFRGIAFEFRFKAQRSRWVWGIAFHVGSLVATFMQGLILRRGRGRHAVAGRQVCARSRVRLVQSVSTPTGVALVFGYALLGATWLKTDGRLQRIAFDLTRPLMLGVIAFMLLVSSWLPFLDPRLMTRWFTGTNFLYLFPPVPLLAILNAALLCAVLANRELQPFVLSLCFFVLGFAGLVAGIWPDIVPPTLTIWQAASPPTSNFVLVGALIMIPAVLAYTAYSYRVRGRLLRMPDTTSDCIPLLVARRPWVQTSCGEISHHHDSGHPYHDHDRSGAVTAGRREPALCVARLPDHAVAEHAALDTWHHFTTDCVGTVRFARRAAGSVLDSAGQCGLEPRVRETDPGAASIRRTEA